MLLLATINKHDTFKCNCDWNVFPTHDKTEFHLSFVACTNVGLDFNTSGRRWRYKSSRKDGVISQLFYETHSPSVHVAMLDTACSKWHCRVTSLSKDVIYEDVCTVGGFFCKIEALYRANRKDTHERLQMRQSVLFLSYLFNGEEWKKLFCLWKFPKSVKCEWEE